MSSLPAMGGAVNRPPPHLPMGYNSLTTLTDCLPCTRNRIHGRNRDDSRARHRPDRLSRAGKTTLLNHILTANHGKRIAVIENEFGEIGVDQDLVINAEEEIFEMNNGCICCTVRGDLIRILGNLMKRRDKFDYILIETTGMADPGPVAQTFFMDDEVQSKTDDRRHRHPRRRQARHARTGISTRCRSRSPSPT